jgi:hypothetical protein
METEGHLPFPDIDVYRKTDVSLAHKVTQTNATPPIPISTYFTIPIIILQTNKQSSLP